MHITMRYNFTLCRVSRDFTERKPLNLSGMLNTRPARLKSERFDSCSNVTADARPRTFCGSLLLRINSVLRTGWTPPLKYGVEPSAVDVARCRLWGVFALANNQSRLGTHDFKPRWGGFIAHLRHWGGCANQHARGVCDFLTFNIEHIELRNAERICLAELEV